MLIDNWRKGHKFLSLQAAGAVYLLLKAEEHWEEVAAMLPPGWVQYGVLIIGVVRVIKQEKLRQLLNQLLGRTTTPEAEDKGLK